MKTSSLMLLLMTVLAGGGAIAQQRQPARAMVQDVAWMSGSWISDAKTATVEERWTPPAGGAMLAVTRTFDATGMISFEYLRIVERAGGLVYVAQPNGRPPTDFVLTAIADRTATFENAEHDFPKMIRYTLRPDGVLEARVSDGGERGETFTFKRAQ